MENKFDRNLIHVSWHDNVSPTTSLRKENTLRLKRLTDILNLEAIKLRFFNGLYTFWANRRLRLGMILLMVVAPVSKFIYLLLPATFGEYLINLGPLKVANTLEGADYNWYWYSIQMYLFSNGELLAPVISFLGVFFLFPKRYYPAYLIGAPFGYYLSMLVHRMFFVYDNQSFHSGFTTAITFAFILFGIILFMLSDKLLDKRGRQQRAVESRVIGLVAMPGMTWEQKEPIIREEVARALGSDNELFDKKTA